MTARTLVSGGGNWSNALSWSPSGVPTAADVLTLSSSSGNLTVDGTSGSPNLCLGVTISGYTGNITMGTTAYIQVGGSTASAFALSTSGTFTLSASATVEFVSTTTGNAFEWLGASFSFSGVGGGWTATTDMSGVGYITHTAGSLTLTSGNQTCFGYSGTGTTTRSLTYAGGANTWTITPQGPDAWDITDSTNMTLSVSSITIVSTTVDCVFNGGGLTYGALIQNTVPGVSTTINQANTFSSLTLSGYSDFLGGYLFGADQTCTGTWTGNGASTNQRLYYHSAVKGSANTISAATFVFSYIDLEDTIKGGAGSGNLSAITGGSGDCTGNSGWTFTTPQNNYWVPAGGTSTGSENVVTNWASSSGGTAGTGRVPLPQDTAIFDANSVDAVSRTITLNIDRMGAHIWTGVTNDPTWELDQGVKFYGSIVMVPGMVIPVVGEFIYAGEQASNLDTGGAAFLADDTLAMDCSTGGTLVIPEGVTSITGDFITLSGTALVLGTFETAMASFDSNTGGTIQIGPSGVFIPLATGFPLVISSGGSGTGQQVCSMYFG